MSTLPLAAIAPRFGIKDESGVQLLYGENPFRRKPFVDATDRAGSPIWDMDDGKGAPLDQGFRTS